MARVLLGALLVALASPACDNPSCVFSGTCFGGGSSGTLGANVASVPSDHAWLLPIPPAVTAAFPSGGDVSSTTALALRFNESINLSSVAASLQLRQVDGGFGGQGLNVPLLPPAALGDGRLVVLLPATALLAEQTYELSVKEDGKVFDLTGTPLQPPADGVLLSFSVAAADPSTPRVVTTWPPSGSSGQSPTGELAVVFDRPIDADSMSVGSFAVTVDGVTPPQNPAPQAAIFSGGSGLPVTDTRAWRWRSVDDDGQAVSLGQGVPVELSLSPDGNKILAEDGTTLPATTIEFDLAAFGSPLSAEVVSLPTDAIGISNLDGSVPLEVAVEVVDGLDSDRLGIFVFGTNLAVDPQLAAVYREVTLGEAGYDPGTGVLTLGEEQLDLTTSTAPVKARFADGELSFALRLERSGTSSAVRLLDIDPDRAGVQSPLLDTTRPTLLDLGSSAGSGLEAQLRSDLEGLVVMGRADEPLRAAEVTCALGDNGPLAPVAAYEESAAAQGEGFFVAAPVPLGLIAPGDLPLDFEVRVYDRALNAAVAPVAGSFHQAGAVGPGAALPGNATVSVEVFDATSLAPVAGARVFTHELSAGAPVLVDSAVSDTDGRATLLASLAADTIVTVDADGYDLFTFSDVPTSRLGVPLEPTLALPAAFQGVLVTTDPSLSNLTKWAQDSRLVGVPAGLVTVQSCSFNPLTLAYDCLFGPAALAAGVPGASALVALNPPPNEVVYSASSFLKSWSAQLPGLPAFGGDPTALSFLVQRALDDPRVPEEERALDGPALELDATGLATLDLSDLVGTPTVTIEARMQSLGGALLAGHGVAFPLAGTPFDTWRVRCAFPGAVDYSDDKYPGDELGTLVTDGVVDPDLFLRLELRDASGRTSVRRPRFSALAGGLPVVAPDAPQVLYPTEDLVTPGASYAVVLSDQLDGSVAADGLHRVTLTASDGRRWRLWHTDLPGTQVRLWLPPIGDAGGTPLVSGPVVAEALSLAWEGLDTALFLWSDVERLYEVRVGAAPVSFIQP